MMPVSKEVSLFVPDGTAELTVVLSAEVDPEITPGTPETGVGVEIALRTVERVGCATGVGETPFSVDGVGWTPMVGTGVASTDPPELPSRVTGIGELSGTGVAVGTRMTVGVATATGDVTGVGVGPVD